MHDTTNKTGTGYNTPKSIWGFCNVLYHSAIEDTVGDRFAAMTVQIFRQHSNVRLLLNFLGAGNAELHVRTKKNSVELFFLVCLQ